MIVICVIGDLVGSRLVKDRRGLQEHLKKSLEKINFEQREHLLSQCTITLGDEYQAVYRDADSLFQDFLAVLHDIYPEKIRFSVGIGSLDTSLNFEQAIGMDGPAFHIAREAMKDSFKRSGQLIHIGHAKKNVPVWIDAALSLVSHEITSWKPTRIQIFRRHSTGGDVKSIAEEIDITQAGIYKNIRSSGMDAIRDLLKEITKWMNAQVTN